MEQRNNYQLFILFVMLAHVFYCIGLSREQRRYIVDHSVTAELKEILDRHPDELEDMVRKCAKFRHCDTDYGVREFEWLPGYYVKYGFFRVEGAENIRTCIENRHLDLLIVPQKYYYHLPWRPDEPDDQNYLVISTEIDLDKRRPLNKAQIGQLMILTEELQIRDNHAYNAIVTRDGKVAFIDTGAEAFWTWKGDKFSRDQRTFLSMAKYVCRSGYYLKDHKLNYEGYLFVLEKIEKFIAHQKNQDWYHDKINDEILSYIKSLPRPWPFDYKKGLQVYAFT